MKVAIITIPMKSPDKVSKFQYSYDGNKEIEYENPVLCPVHAVLAKTLKKGEYVRVLYVLTTGKHSNYKQNAENFKTELNEINNERANLNYKTIEIEFKPTKETYEKILLLSSKKLEYILKK